MVDPGWGTGSLTETHLLIEADFVKSTANPLLKRLGPGLERDSEPRVSGPEFDLLHGSSGGLLADSSVEHKGGDLYVYQGTRDQERDGEPRG